MSAQHELHCLARLKEQLSADQSRADYPGQFAVAQLVAGPSVIIFPEPGNAAGQDVIDNRRAEESFGHQVMKISLAHREVAGRRIRRLSCEYLHRTARGIAAEQGALRPLFNLYPDDIRKIDVIRRLVRLVDAVHVHRHIRFGAGRCGSGRHATDGRLGIDAEPVHAKTRRDQSQGRRVRHAACLQCLSGYRGDGDGHIADALRSPLRGDHDFLKFHRFGVAGAGLGGRCRAGRRTSLRQRRAKDGDRTRREKQPSHWRDLLIAIEFSQ